MMQIIPVASGKGGVGKTLFSANMGITLSRLGKTVILVDLDLGGSNLHTCLGVKNTHTGIGNMMGDKTIRVEELLVETEYPRLYLIPGDALIPGSANLPYFVKKKVFAQLKKLTADYLILDLGSGTSNNVIDFYIGSTSGIIVTTPETTALLNAYAFIKTTLFRIMYLAQPPKSPTRECITSFVRNRTEGSGKSYFDLCNEISAINGEAGQRTRNLIENQVFNIVVNMGQSQDDLVLGTRLREIVKKNLGIDIVYTGFLPWDEEVSLSILKRKPITAALPDRPYSRAITELGSRIIQSAATPASELYDDDIAELSKTFYELMP